ncbi:hypothetical phage protein [Citrobacter phage CR8]|uniref:Hypothetical phage protein n=1 Tax=Citrobacter phage CR8 TaxID=1455076 RepID=W6PP46_9CAUD|nr:hypothetical protein CF79_gp15 [Citrobacter phage CR8]EDW9662057.1 hypothetical protein [Salmonella enterica subsp. enterica serovar Newport]CDM21599.1 hypothetical phage protein [Citrobacter phage CR8]
MSKNLMFNRFTKSFHLSHNPFSFHKGSLPRFGKTVALAPAVHALVTRKSFLKAVNKEAVSVPVVVTKWPRLKLALLVIKEKLQ